MKKKAPIVFIIVSVFAVAAIIIISAYRSSESYRKAKAAIQWDCSVSCTEKSTSAQYVITYSNVKVSSKTGTLTIQNRNDFEIVVHLLCEGEQEIVSGNISAGGCYSFANVTDKEYTVGIHADVDAATNIKVIVYDGKDTEPYTNWQVGACGGASIWKSINVHAANVLLIMFHQRKIVGTFAQFAFGRMTRLLLLIATPVTWIME